MEIAAESFVFVSVCYGRAGKAFFSLDGKVLLRYLGKSCIVSTAQSRTSHAIIREIEG